MRVCIGIVWLLCTGLVHSAKLQVGDVAPDLVGRDSSGALIKLSDYSGTVRVVSFWATWCAPCRSEMSFLDQVQKQVSAEHLQVIAVNIEDRRVYRKVVKQLAAEVGITLTHDGNGAIARRYAVGAIPHTVVIGRDGKVVEVHVGFSDERMDELIEQLNAQLALPAA
jgi:peroxiredoxin